MIPFLITTIITRHVVKGLAVQPYLLYVASAIDMMGGYSFAAARAAVSKCVEMDELGKVRWQSSLGVGNTLALLNL